MPKQIDIAAFAEAYAAGAPVVDVREPDEYEQAHLPGAVLIPLGTLPVRATEIDPDTTTYLICKVGGRSMYAAQALEAAGYDVVNVAGGMDEWIGQGRPYEQGPVQG